MISVVITVVVILVVRFVLLLSLFGECAYVSSLYSTACCLDLSTDVFIYLHSFHRIVWVCWSPVRSNGRWSMQP